MDLKALISRGESENLEFKKLTREWKEIVETISAYGVHQLADAKLRSSKVLHSNISSGRVYLNIGQASLTTTYLNTTIIVPE